MHDGIFVDIIAAGIVIFSFGVLIHHISDWRRPLGPWCRNRNLYIIVIIWVTILISLYYEKLADIAYMDWNIAYYDWAMSGDYETRDAIQTEQYETALKEAEKADLFRRIMWGTVFTGYFLNAHSKVMKSEQ